LARTAKYWVGIHADIAINMSDGQFPAKQAERDEYSVAEESHIASRQPRLSEVLKARAARKRG